MVNLRGWSDADIMECDLLRLDMAVTAMAKETGREWRLRFRIAGHDVKEPGDAEEVDDETFNQNVRDAMAMFKRQGSRMKSTSS